MTFDNAHTNKMLIAGGVITIAAMAAMARAKVVKIASRYVGEQEIQKNQGFQNKAFQYLLENYGWIKGQPWCMSFLKAIYSLAYPEKKQAINLIHPHSQITLRNFLNAGYRLHKKPKRGDIAIFQNVVNGTPQNSGHGAIVTASTGMFFTTIEGNWTDKVSRKTRILNYNLNHGLRLKGFIRL